MGHPNATLDKLSVPSSHKHQVFFQGIITVFFKASLQYLIAPNDSWIRLAFSSSLNFKLTLETILFTSALIHECSKFISMQQNFDNMQT